MTEAKACKCDWHECAKVEQLRSPESHPPGWVMIFGWPTAGRLDFCSPGHLIAWASAPQIRYPGGSVIPSALH